MAKKLKRCGNNNVGWTYGDDQACMIGDNARMHVMRGAAKTEADTYFSMSQFDASRTLFMFDDFYQESAQKLIEGMLKLDAESNEPINIVINSYGGSIYSMFAIIDAMSELDSQINTICLGEADSAGASLLASGDMRFIGKNSRTMIHEVSTMTWGKVSELDAEIADAKKLNERYIRHMATACCGEYEAFAEIMKKDTFMNAEESKKMGLVDGILDMSAMKTLMTGLEESIQDVLVASHSRTKDALLSDLLFAKATKVETKTNADVQAEALDLANQNLSREGDEKNMNRNELCAALKEQGVDVEALEAKAVEAVARVSELETALHNVSEELVAERAAKEETAAAEAAVKIEALLGEMITDGKSTQVLNDTMYRAFFTASGIDKAVEVAALLPKLLKTEQEAAPAAAVDVEMSAAAQEDVKIQAIMVEKSMNYSDAEKELKRLAREENIGKETE